MKKITLTKIIVWLMFGLNIALFTNIIPQAVKEYKEFCQIVWHMDSTQNRLIKELVNSNNKMVDNQNLLFERVIKLEETK